MRRLYSHNFGVWVSRDLLSEWKQDKIRGLTRGLYIRSLDGFHVPLENVCKNIIDGCINVLRPPTSAFHCTTAARCFCTCDATRYYSSTSTTSINRRRALTNAPPSTDTVSESGLPSRRANTKDYLSHSR